MKYLTWKILKTGTHITVVALLVVLVVIVLNMFDIYSWNFPALSVEFTVHVPPSANSVSQKLHSYST